MAAKYCIICGEKRDGLEVQNDRILEAIRWFKANVTKDVHGNTLVVCKECYPKWKKNRDKYSTRQLLYVGLGVAFAIISLLLSTRPTTLLAGIALIAFLYLLSLLSYTPALKMPKNAPHPRK